MSLPLQRRIQEVRGGAFLAGKNSGASRDESGRSPGSHQVNVSLWFLVVVAYIICGNIAFTQVSCISLSTRIRTCQYLRKYLWYSLYVSLWSKNDNGG